LSAMWETQKAMYTALTSNSNLMTLVSSRIYDEPPTDSQYPYIVLGDMVEIDQNRLAYRGFEISATFNIYTKAEGLGYYTAKKILEEMNNSLNCKKLALTGYTMVICKFDNSYTDREEDKRVLSVRYMVLVDNDTLITF